MPTRRERAWLLTDWLLGDGRKLSDNGALFAGFCRQVMMAEVPLDRAALHLRALNPQYRGVSRIWRPDQPLSERFMDHGIEKTAMFIESPVHAAAEAKTKLGWHLDDGRPPYPVLEELRDEGFAHYVIIPFTFGVGLIHALALATRRRGGFTAEDLEFFDQLLPALAAVVELNALRRFIPNILATYVGDEPGRLILEGQVQRGDVIAITAALMLVDLRDFTLLSDTMRPRAVVRMLNEYFDDVIPRIQENHGEVMEIMGDGILAIFRQGNGTTAAEACGAALAAARRALAAVDDRNHRNRPGDHEMRIGIALHYGTVSYGNIGTHERLDFTVIGPDVNLTSRIERLCRELDRSLIMSEPFATTLGSEVWELGAFELRGFARMQRLFELPHE